MRHIQPISVPQQAAAPGIEGVMDSLIGLGNFLVGYIPQKQALDKRWEDDEEENGETPAA